MLEKSCSEFIEVLASKAPVPGGGGGSALAGALGMALGSMVGNLTLGKKKYADVEEDIKELLEKSQDVIDNLKRLVNEDAEAFFPVSKAYGLPQNTEEEKAAKEKALQESLVGATMVPLEICKYCYKAIELHEEYAKKGTALAISDVGVGVILCKAALQGAKLNILINTKLMKDQELKENIESQLKEIEDNAYPKADEIYQNVVNLLK